MNYSPPKSTKSKLEFAVEHVLDGWKVFPVKPDTSKAPLIKGGFHARTDNLKQIENWLAQWPDANIGIVPADKEYAVVECDNYKPEFDQTAFDALNLPATYTVRSARGGFHYYFKGDLQPTKGKLGKGIDTRGQASYVLAPGSIINESPYTVEV